MDVEEMKKIRMMGRKNEMKKRKDILQGRRTMVVDLAEIKKIRRRRKNEMNKGGHKGDNGGRCRRDDKENKDDRKNEIKEGGHKEGR